MFVMRCTACNLNLSFVEFTLRNDVICVYIFLDSFGRFAYSPFLCFFVACSWLAHIQRYKRKLNHGGHSETRKMNAKKPVKCIQKKQRTSSKKNLKEQIHSFGDIVSFVASFLPRHSRFCFVFLPLWAKQNKIFKLFRFCSVSHLLCRLLTIWSSIHKTWAPFAVIFATYKFNF